jgi:hypothetical protein
VLDIERYTGQPIRVDVIPGLEPVRRAPRPAAKPGYRGRPSAAAGGRGRPGAGGRSGHGGGAQRRGTGW